VLTASVWLSTGTMAPYAATTNPPLVLGPCGYLYNGDHDHFRATFLMLDGAPRAQWEFSVVLRRILFPLFAYPFMKLAGFERGGVAASLVLHWVAFLAFGSFLRRRVGEAGATAGVWLLATYPGIPYWAGLPYSYAAIVPGSLLSFIFLCRMAGASSLAQAAASSLGLGVLATGYDFLPIFGVAAVLVLLAQRRVRWLPGSFASLVAPTALCAVWLQSGFHVPLSNSNSAIYGNILHAWLHPSGLAQWKEYLVRLPAVALDSYLYANFLFLPLLFVLLLAAAARAPGTRLSVSEKAILAAAALLFLFNNAAPPYAGVQVRGTALPRLYQPMFVVFLFFAGNAVAAAPAGPRRRLYAALCACTVLADATVSFGPALHVPWAADIYIRFYKHTSPDWLERNLARHGRRPLGFCKS
jgi:hypothetical protein